MTNEVEAAALAYIARIDEMGGAVAAVESGYMQDEIEQAAYEYAKAVESGDQIVVGVNRFAGEDAAEPEAFPIDPSLQRGQIERLRALRASRDQSGVDAAIDDVRAAARGTQNLLVPDARGAAAPGDSRGGFRRPPRGLRGVPAESLTGSGVPVGPGPEPPALDLVSGEIDDGARHGQGPVEHGAVGGRAHGGGGEARLMVDGRK